MKYDLLTKTGNISTLIRRWGGVLTDWFIYIPFIQCNQLTCPFFFRYLVNNDLSNEGVYCSIHLASHFLQGTTITGPCPMSPCRLSGSGGGPGGGGGVCRSHPYCALRYSGMYKVAHLGIRPFFLIYFFYLFSPGVCWGVPGGSYFI